MKHLNFKNKIWQVIDSRNYGGIESHILYLTCALVERNRDVCVVFINDYGTHALEGKLTENNVPFVKCRGVQDFLKFVRHFTPRILHSHGYKANLVSRVAGQLYNIPTVSSFHAGDCETFRLKIYTFLDRKTAFLSKPIAINTLIAHTLTGKPQVIDNFVPLSKHHRVVNSLRHIGFVGRLSHEKGPDRFIDLARAFPHINFHIFGDGPLRTVIECAAPNNVRLHGHVDSMETAWKTMDILCMPSRKEGLPMAALEAMARGIPVLAYGAGALPKLIQHGVNGWISDLPDDQDVDTQDLAEILKNITVENMEACSTYARQTIIDDYCPQALISHFLTIYDDKIGCNTNINTSKDDIKHAAL